MSGYRPKSLDELNDMYDKALSAQRAIKRGTSKINENNSSTFFDDVIKEAELSVTKNTAEKPIADLSGAVDDFIKHFSEGEEKPVSHMHHRKEAVKPAAPKHTAGTAAVASKNRVPTVTRKHTDEEITALMSDYVRIMNDHDDFDDEPKRKFTIRKKDKKKSAEVKEEKNEIKEELTEETEDINEEVSAEIKAEETEAPVNKDSLFTALSDESDEETEALPEEEAAFPFEEEEEVPEEATEEKKVKEKKIKEKKVKEKGGKNNARVFFRVLLSLVLTVCVILTVSVGSLSTVFNVNTGKEAPGEYYLFTASHDFPEVDVENGDFVICRKQSTVEDGEKAVYIDLENKTFTFGVKNGGRTNGEGDIIYFVGTNEVERDSVLGTVDKTVSGLGKIVNLIYRYYIPVVAALASLCAILLLGIIFVLKKKNTKPEELSDVGEASAEAGNEEQLTESLYDDEETEEAEEEPDSEADLDMFDDVDLFSDLD